MINWLLKNIYASVEIQDGSISNYFPKIPKGFILDLKDIISSLDIKNGLVLIKNRNGQPHLFFKGDFNASAKQRILNCWGFHKAKYK